MALSLLAFFLVAPRGRRRSANDNVPANAVYAIAA